MRDEDNQPHTPFADGPSNESNQTDINPKTNLIRKGIFQFLNTSKLKGLFLNCIHPCTCTYKTNISGKGFVTLVFKLILLIYSYTTQSVHTL